MSEIGENTECYMVVVYIGNLGGFDLGSGIESEEMWLYLVYFEWRVKEKKFIFLKF